MTSCVQCHTLFETPQQEVRICNALGIPLPDICPRCSWQRHFLFRNDMHLYRRTCDATGKELLSVYAPVAPHTIYDHTVWNSDVWDATDYGLDIDFTRPFFEQFAQLFREVPRPSKFIPKSLGENINSEYTNCSVQLQNCYMVFSASESQECYYGELYYKSKDCVDGLRTFYSELCYETVEVERCYHCQFLLNCHDCTDSAFLVDCTNFPGGMQRLAFCMGCTGAVSDLWYCDLCDNAQSCFGCIGVRSKSYCILNKQYEKEEYEALKLQLIDHMKATGEWGKFFPAALSPFGYNETFAIDYFPLSKEQAQQHGFHWHDTIDGSVSEPTLYASHIPDHIEDVDGTIVNEILSCIACKRNYKLVKQELLFYRKHGLPVPRTCFRCRHVDRLSERNGVQLFSRMCACSLPGHDHSGQCSHVFDTTYAPADKARVCCESCYQKL